MKRVQAWRQANPRYWRLKTDSLEDRTLQDECITEVVDEEQEKADKKYAEYLASTA
jgi:hypothetical protein